MIKDLRKGSRKYGYYKLLVLISLLISLVVQARTQENTDILSFDEYLNVIKEHHPIARQARLVNLQSEAIERTARGGFDPKLFGSYARKDFNEKEYYRLLETGIELPTWFGVKLKADFRTANGLFVNDMDEMPDRGQWSFGIDLPLGRGLLLDKRRADLLQANLFQKAVKWQQQKMLNELLANSIQAYQEWQLALGQLQIQQEGLQLASIRFSATRSSFRNGDRPAIDTLEASIAVQNRQLALLEAQQNLDNSRYLVQSYLWLEGDTPLLIEAGVVPEALNAVTFGFLTDSLNNHINTLLSNHPELLLLDNQIQQLDVDFRLETEEMKPDFRIQFNPLIGNEQEELFIDPELQNYKMGASLSFPILMRKASGKREQIALKRRDTELKTLDKNNEILNKLKVKRNNIEQLLSQESLLQVNVQNYNRLLNAERRKFQIGESSQFLLNNRENKYLESQQKLQITRWKLLKERVAFLELTGVLSEMILSE